MFFFFFFSRRRSRGHAPPLSPPLSFRPIYRLLFSFQTNRFLKERFSSSRRWPARLRSGMRKETYITRKRDLYSPKRDLLTDLLRSGMRKRASSYTLLVSEKRSTSPVKEPYITRKRDLYSPKRDLLFWLAKRDLHHL